MESTSDCFRFAASAMARLCKRRVVLRGGARAAPQPSEEDMHTHTTTISSVSQPDIFFHSPGAAVQEAQREEEDGGARRVDDGHLRAVTIQKFTWCDVRC